MNKLILFFLAMVTLISCSILDDEERIQVSGKVIRNINGEGIPNQKVTLEILKSHGSGIFSYTEKIDSTVVITDSEGRFSTSMKNDNNTYISTYKEGDDMFTEVNLKYFELHEEVIIKVDKYVKFKIFVKNVNPYDENDYIYMDFFSGLTQSFRTDIENFGVNNNFIPEEGSPGGGIIGRYDLTSWYGTNVNSVVYFNVPESAEDYKIYWIMIKNEIETTGFTEEIPYELDSINEYEFYY